MHDTQSAYTQNLPKQYECNVSVIMKTMNNVPFRLLPQWVCGNSCTSAHDVQLHFAGFNEPRVFNKKSKECKIHSNKCSTRNRLLKP